MGLAGSECEKRFMQQTLRHSGIRCQGFFHCTAILFQCIVCGMSTNNPVVQTIKREMERKDLNGVDLAALSGVSVSNVYAVLSGENSNPTWEVLDKLARAVKLKVVAQ